MASNDWILQALPLPSTHSSGIRVAGGDGALSAPQARRTPVPESRSLLNQLVDRQRKELPPPSLPPWRTPGARLPAGPGLSAAHWPDPSHLCRWLQGDVRPPALALRPPLGPRHSRGDLHPAPGRARSGAGSGRRAGNPAGSTAARPWCTGSAAAAPVPLGCTAPPPLHLPVRLPGRRAGGAPGARQ